VTYAERGGRGLFPDAVSVRAGKHLRELIAMAEQGHRAVLLYCVQHNGIDWVEPADAIDPDYGRLLRQAINAGVEVLAYKAKLTAREIVLTEKVAIEL